MFIGCGKRARLMDRQMLWDGEMFTDGAQHASEEIGMNEFKDLALKSHLIISG